MQHTLTNPPASGAEFDSLPTLNVVIAYQDLGTGKHAKRTYDFLVEHLGSDCQFHNQMWNFDILSIPKLREIAGQDAAAADIVVISSHGNELPAHVKTWIEEWLGEPNRPLALVALFDLPSAEASKTRGVRNYLAEVARRGDMEFFAQPDEWPGQTKAAENPQLLDIGGLDQRTLSKLADVVERDALPPRWRSFE
jgi:hypothetical protein